MTNINTNRAGEYVYCYEMQNALKDCDFSAEFSYYSNHYYLRAIKKDLPKLCGRGIKYNEKHNCYIVTRLAYKKIITQYRIIRETSLN